GGAQVLHEGALARMPGGDVALVDAVDLPLLRPPDVGVREEELPARAIHGEAVRPLSRRIDEGGGRTVHHVPSRDLIRARTERGGAGRIHAAAPARRGEGGPPGGEAASWPTVRRDRGAPPAVWAPPLAHPR